MNARATAMTLAILIVALSGGRGEAFPTARSGVSMDAFEAQLSRGETHGLWFHPWLTMRTFDVLARHGTSVAEPLRLQAAVGSIEEDADVGACSVETLYAELGTGDAVPTDAEIAARALENGRAALAKRLGFPPEDLAKHLDDWRSYLGLASLVGLKWERVAFLREALADYPFHRSENHFLAAPGQAQRALRDSPEFVTVERNASTLEWLTDPRNRCGQAALEKALTDGDDSRAFRSLGHVLHLLQDAAVPAHVRNDTHAPVPHPWRFVASLFAPAGVDLRGDRSFDWFDPVEDLLSKELSSFVQYDALLMEIAAAAEFGKAVAPADAIEQMSAFVRERFYSRDTILRTHVGSVEIGAVPLAEEALLRDESATWCLRNRWGERVACATAGALRDAGLLDGSKAPPKRIPLPTGEVRESLLRGAALAVTDVCVHDYLRVTVPRLMRLSMGVVRWALARRGAPERP